ncbi:hypothetical protein GCM10010441_75520 [Kitasatospora paracochleata]|uniref:Lipoprotein n=1 Tax=Kitasatospora paracochleata TaxID=58354 RepID=A0ABT1J9Z6_9ACTN|nr:hypothetical protein [Kitasatospora paracochleata]MCP2314265.1 hypothetical protein [Kitasatospora paracochleata]
MGARGTPGRRSAQAGTVAAALLLLAACTATGADEAHPAAPTAARPSSGAPGVPVRAAEPVAEQDRWVLDALRSMDDAGRLGHPAPTAGQLMVLAAAVNGEATAAWLPDSRTVCAFWLTLADDGRPSPPGRRDGRGTVHTVSCGDVPERPGTIGLKDDAAQADGISFVVLLAGRDEPLAMSDGWGRERYGPLRQQVARAADGRTFHVAWYQFLTHNGPQTYLHNGLTPQARLCTVSGDLCREPMPVD